MLEIFITTIISIVVFLSWNFFLYSREKRGTTLFIESFLFLYAQIIITEMLLGFLSILVSGWLLALNATIVIAIYLLGKIKATPREYFDATKTSLQSLFASLKDDKPLLLLSILCTLALLWIVFLGVLFPVLDWDGNSYHMTFIGTVFQNHNIYDVPASLGWISGYPKSGELITLWNVIFTHKDTVADLVQLPFIFLAIVSIYGISKTLGAKKEVAAFTSLLIVFIPVVVNQLKTTYLDVMLPSLFFASIYLLLKKKHDLITISSIGIAAGIIFSLKSAGIIFLIVIGLWLFISLLKDAALDIKHKLLILVIFSTPVLIGSFWYFKNLFMYQNPIYPYGLKALGHQIFQGQSFDEGAAEAMKAFPFFPKGMLQRMWFVWTEQKDWWGCLYNYDANFTGFGPVWFIFILPALLIQALVSPIKRNTKFLLYLVSTLAILAIYPLNYYTRYTVFIIGVGLAALAITISGMSERAAKISKYMLIALSGFAFLTTLSLCNYPPLTIKNQLKVSPPDDRRGTAYKSVIGPAYLYIQDHAGNGDVVVYTRSSMFVYPLWNRQYSNKVIYIKANDIQQWSKKVKESGAKYVFTHKLSPESESLRDSGYKRVYEDNEYEIYKTN